MQALCGVLENSHGLQMAWQLQVQDEHARALAVASDDSWVAEEMARVNPDQLDTSIAWLEKNLGEVGGASSTGEVGKWLARSRSL